MMSYSSGTGSEVIGISSLGGITLLLLAATVGDLPSILLAIGLQLLILAVGYAIE